MIMDIRMDTSFINRRKFLQKSTSFLLGTCIGAGSLKKAFAVEEPPIEGSLRPRIALIIDDIGYSYRRARQFLKLDLPLTFSILPKLPKSHQLAIEISDHGREIMLHQPMEPYNQRLDPGPGALYIEDEEEKIIKIIKENIVKIPFAVGVNNHMGSKFTESYKKINEALSVVKEQGLFFVDSLTSSRSVAHKTAEELNMMSARNSAFIDNRLREPAIYHQLRKLKLHAQKYGCALGIGHPYPVTARAIDRFFNGNNDPGVDMVPVTDVLKTAS